jgi:hypothetical protein
MNQEASMQDEGDIPQLSQSKKRKKGRKRTLSKKKKNCSSDEGSESDTVLEVTEKERVLESIDDWPPERLTTALELKENLNIVSYKTGTKIDELFPDGIKCREIIELCGPHQCGKTKMAMSIAISLLLNYKDEHAVYLYTNNDFHECNVRKIVMSRGLQDDAVKDVMSRIKLFPIDDTTELVDSLKEISNTNAIDTYKFVFLDSITVPFYHAKTVDANVNSLMISKVHELMFKIAKIHHKTVSSKHPKCAKKNLKFNSRFSSQIWHSTPALIQLIPTKRRRMTIHRLQQTATRQTLKG